MEKSGSIFFSNPLAVCEGLAAGNNRADSRNLVGSAIADLFDANRIKVRYCGLYEIRTHPRADIPGLGLAP